MDTQDTPTQTSPPRPGAGAIYQWHDAAIHAESLHFPPHLREDYVWLKCHAREECARDVDLLTERIRHLGYSHDKTTVAKIMRGRWNRSSTGQAMAHPVISEEAFASLVKSLRDGVRAEALRGRVPFIQTSVTRSIWEYIETKRGVDRVNKFGIVVGPTGSSKSATFTEFCRVNNHGTCIHIEAPESGAIGELVTTIAGRYGYSGGLNVPAKRAAILATLTSGDRRTRASRTIIVDNCQDLYRSAQQEQPAFSYLRRLQDVTGCTVILSITPTFERRLMGEMINGYFEQFEGRSGGRDTWLRLPEHAPDEDVVAIAQAFGVQSAKSHAKELARIAQEPGRIRRLFEVLQDAKVAAEAEGAKLTIDIIREIRGEDA